MKQKLNEMQSSCKQQIVENAQKNRAAQNLLAISKQNESTFSFMQNNVALLTSNENRMLDRNQESRNN